MQKKKMLDAYGVKKPEQPAADTSSINDTEQTPPQRSLEQEFLWARFKRNRDFLTKNDQFKQLFNKEEEWTEQDLVEFRKLIQQLKI